MMNERIKELAVKAQVEHCVSHVRLQEFAELIVRECAEVSRQYNFHERSLIAMYEHFGMDATEIFHD